MRREAYVYEVRQGTQKGNLFSANQLTFPELLQARPMLNKHESNLIQGGIAFVSTRQVAAAICNCVF